MRTPLENVRFLPLDVETDEGGDFERSTSEGRGDLDDGKQGLGAKCCVLILSVCSCPLTLSLASPLPDVASCTKLHDDIAASQNLDKVPFVPECCSSLAVSGYSKEADTL